MKGLVRRRNVAFTLGLLLLGCSDSKPCNKACNHLATCLGADPVGWSCPLSASCPAADACRADCALAASCDAINGVDSAGEAAYQACVTACGNAPAPDGGLTDGQPATDGGGGPQQSSWYFPQGMERDVDILFMIDNSNSMYEEQINLAQNFPKLIEAMREPKLGGAIPNLHIGIVTSDVGAGNYNLPTCETVNGDKGKLQSKPTAPGCVPPAQPYISYIDGQTNIPEGSTDQVQRVKEAFQCIANVGTGGCGFEQSLESVRRALDPAKNVNPGFVRQDAVLVVVLITDEDDCSAAKSELYDPSQASLTDPLGPLTSFRCFEFGVQCDINDRTVMGPRKNCQPAYDWLHSVQSYVSFFKGLKPPGRVLLFAVAGPTNKVEVGKDGQNPALQPSCLSSNGSAVPGIRLRALTEAFGSNGFYNRGLSSSDEPVALNICAADFSPALRLLGRKLRGTLGAQCLGRPLLTAAGGLACNGGDTVSPGTSCASSCLQQADCTVKQGVGGNDVQVQRCPSGLFSNPQDTSCGSSCPCWRIVPSSDCAPAVDGSPYALEVLRDAPAVKGTVATVTCKTANSAWGSAGLASLPQCN